MPEIIDIEDPTAQPEEPVEQNIPEGMRQTTIPERLTSVAANIAGGVAGLGEATAEGLYDIGTAPLRAVGIMEGDLLPEGYEKAYEGSKTIVSERLDKDFVDNLGKNFSDLLEGFVTIVSSPLNVQEFVQEDKTFFDVVADQTEKAYGTTEDLHEVVYSDMANLLNPINIVDNLQTRPLDVGLTMLPVARAAKNVGKAAVIKAAESGTKVTPAAKSMIKAAEKIDKKLTELLEPVIRSSSYTALKRWISDPSAQTTPELQDIARRFLDEPAEARARFDAAFEEAAHRILADEAAAIPVPVQKTKATKPHRGVDDEGNVGPFDVEEAKLQEMTREELAAVRAEDQPQILAAPEDNVIVLDQVRRAILGEGAENMIVNPELALPMLMDIFENASVGPAAQATIQMVTSIRNAIRPYLAKVLESPKGFEQLKTKIKEMAPNEKQAKGIIDDLEKWRQVNKEHIPEDRAFPAYTTADNVYIDTAKILEDIAHTDGVINAAVAEEVFSIIARDIAPQVESSAYKLILADLLEGGQGNVFQVHEPTGLHLVSDAPIVTVSDMLSELMGTKTTNVPLPILMGVDDMFPPPGAVGRTMEVKSPPKYPAVYSTPTAKSRAAFERARQHLDLDRDSLVAEIAQKTGRPKAVIEVEIDALSKQMNTMKPISKDAAELLGMREGDLMIPAGLDSTLKWQNKAMNIAFGDTAMDILNRTIKRNLVVLNPSSHLNNIMSNLMILTLRNANPKTFTQLLTDAKKYYQYVKGNRQNLTPDEILAFEELRKTNLIDTSLADIDLSLGRGINLDIPGTKLLNESLTKGYKLGDTIFKVQVFMDEFKKLQKALEVMNEGESITIMPKKGKKVTMEKGYDGMTINGADISEASLMKLLRETASQKAKNLFFDYSDVGNYAKMLRAVPAMGILSPFYIWFLKSMDIPGFQKGLAGHTVTSSSVPWVATSSPKLNMVAAKGDSMLALRRAAVVSGLKSQLAENEEFKEILDWLPKDLGTHLIDMTLDPGYARTRDFRWMNPYEGTYQMLDGLSGMFKLGVDAVANTYTPASLHLDQTIAEIKKDPEIAPDEKRDIIKMRNWWHRWHSGRGQDMGTLANIMGTAGSYFFDLLSTVKLSEEQGVDFDAGKFSRTLAAALMGGVYSKALRGALGLTDLKDVDGFKTLIGRMPLDPDVTQENDLRWFVRTLTGQLMKKRDLWKSYKWFFKGLRREYKNSIIKPIWDRAKALEAAGHLDEADRLDAVADKWLEAINNDLEIIEEEYASQIEALKHRDIK